jgi:hypothetical protein
MTQRQPILLNTCAVASTAREAASRIDFNDFEPRSVRVIALDAGAADVVRRLSSQDWSGGRFLLVSEADEERQTLLTMDGQTCGLADELDDCDAVVMIASPITDVVAAGRVGDAAAARPVMSAALVLAGPDESADAAVTALRENAMVMLVLREVPDLVEVLTALRV